MRLQYKKNIIEVYDTIQDLSIARFQKYQLYAAIDAHIGSDLDATNTRLINIVRLIDKDPKDAKIEVLNLQENLNFIVTQSSPKLMSFAVLIRKINGRTVDEKELNDDGIKELLNELSETRTPYKLITNFLNRFKKKIEQELELFFPSTAENVKIKEFFILLKKRVQLTLQAIYTEETNPEIDEIDAELIAMYKPRLFHGRNGVEVRSIQDFERSCLIIHQNHISQNAAAMSVLSFYQALESIKERIKNAKK